MAKKPVYGNESISSLKGADRVRRRFRILRLQIPRKTYVGRPFPIGRAQSRRGAGCAEAAPPEADVFGEPRAIRVRTAVPRRGGRKEAQPPRAGLRRAATGSAGRLTAVPRPMQGLWLRPERERVLRFVLRFVLPYRGLRRFGGDGAAAFFVLFRDNK